MNLQVLCQKTPISWNEMGVCWSACGVLSLRKPQVCWNSASNKTDVWGYLNAEKPAQRKAISENVLHKSEQITDAVYSSFQESELKNQIVSLGNNGGSENGLSDGDIERISREIAKYLGS